MIGTDKSDRGGGIAVYDLSGRELQFRADGKLNNVDLRNGVLLDGEPTVVVSASNRTDNTLRFYRLDTTVRRLEPITSATVTTGFEPYGLCMYQSRKTGKVYAFVTQNGGGVLDQYELLDLSGKVGARKVRSMSVGSLSEGCVADDALGHLYVAEEDVGIWRYSAEPDAGTSRTVVGTVGDGHLVADVEGLALAAGTSGSGYLIASSQGDSSYAVYDRTTGRWMRSFRIDGAGSVDGTDETDGMDAAVVEAGSSFRRGLLVVHDAINSGSESSNYKLVDLAFLFES